MSYVIVIEKFEFIDEDNFNITELLRNRGLSLQTALGILRCFVLQHPNGYLLEGSSHLVKYEVESGGLSCWIDFDD